MVVFRGKINNNTVSIGWILFHSAMKILFVNTRLPFFKQLFILFYLYIYSMEQVNKTTD